MAVEDLAEEHAEDEFAAHFAAERPPNVLLTTNYRPSKVMYQFLADLLDVRLRAFTRPRLHTSPPSYVSSLQIPVCHCLSKTTGPND